jgi:DnaJ-class molecular chaperone
MPHLDDSCLGANLQDKGIYPLMNEKVWDRCGNCCGTGKIHGGLRPKRRCPACEGTGYVQTSVWVTNMPETISGVEKTVLQRRQVKPHKRAKPG